MAGQAIGIRHSQKTFTDSGNPQGSVFSYVDSIRIHIDRSAIGLVVPILGRDGTIGAVRRSDPYRAIGSLFDINIFKNEWVCDLELLLAFWEKHQPDSCVGPHCSSAIDKNTVGVLFRVASMWSSDVPVGTFKPRQPVQSRDPHSTLHVLRKLPDSTSGKAFRLRELRHAPILQKTDPASLAADPAPTLAHRGDDRAIAWKHVSLP